MLASERYMGQQCTNLAKVIIEHYKHESTINTRECNRVMSISACRAEFPGSLNYQSQREHFDIN